MNYFLYQDDIPSNIKFDDVIAIDTETMGLNLQRDRLCLIQLSNGDGNAHLVQIIGQEIGDIEVNDSAGVRASFGIGATWDSPLGPLSLDYGIPIRKESFDVEQRFRFSISTSF